MKALHVWVSGKVQGVFFRDSTRRRADELGLRGWVKNTRDSDVEALFVGDKVACEEALAYVHEGPPMASVSRVRHEWEEPPTNLADRFEIRY